MARRIIWLAIPILLIVVFLQGRNLRQSSSQMSIVSDGGTSIGLIMMMVAVVPLLLYSVFRSTRRGQAIIHDDPNAEVVLSDSALDMVPIVMAIIGGAISAYWLLSQDAPTVMAWMMAFGAIALSAACALVALTRIMSGPFKLSLSGAGLDYGPFKCGPIAWRDIRRVELKRFLSSEVISIEVSDPEKYFARGFPKIGRNPGRYAKGLTSPFVISPRQIRVSSDRLIDAIKARLAVFGSASDSKGSA